MRLVLGSLGFFEGNLSILEESARGGDLDDYLVIVGTDHVVFPEGVTD